MIVVRVCAVDQKKSNAVSKT